MSMSKHEHDLRKCQRILGAHSLNLNKIKNATMGAHHNTPGQAFIRNSLQRLKHPILKKPATWPALRPPPHKHAGHAEWKNWASHTLRLLASATKQRMSLTRARLAQAKSDYFQQRHYAAASYETYRVTKNWKGDKPPPLTVMSTWTTKNDFSTDHPTCSQGCEIIKDHCKSCGARAYVTGDPARLRQQAAETFRKKLAKRKPICPDLIQYKPDKYGAPIAHLTDEPPDPSTLPHPAQASIHSLLHPSQVPIETTQHYHDIMRPPTYEEFSHFLKQRKGNTAPGPSKFRYCLILRGPEVIHKILHKITCICLRMECLPTKLKAAHLYPIPKADGARLLSAMRPITLLEVSYKLTTGWLAHQIRQHSLDAPHPLWHEDQYGATGGTHDALLRFSAALEDAQDHPDQDILCCLADVASAYDSVSPESKSLTYRRAGLPESFINFAHDLDCDATTQVLAPQAGPADPFTVESGFRQGDPLSVIGWLCFVNPILEWMNKGIQSTPNTCPDLSYTPAPHTAQARYNGTHRRDDAKPAGGSYTLRYSKGKTTPLMYMDDAGFVTQTLRDLVTQLERFSLYLAFHDVHTHPKKTIFTGKSTKPNPEWVNKPPAVFTRGNWEQITYKTPDTPIKYLGVHFQVSGGWTHQLQALRSNTHRLINAAHSHSASLSEMRYFTSSTIQASAIYRTALVPLHLTELADLDRRIIRSLNRSARLRVTAPHWRWMPPPL